MAAGGVNITAGLQVESTADIANLRQLNTVILLAWRYPKERKRTYEVKLPLKSSAPPTVWRAGRSIPFSAVLFAI